MLYSRNPSGTCHSYPIWLERAQRLLTVCGFGPIFVYFQVGYLARMRALAHFCEVFEFMQITVRDNNVDQALRALKKKLQREGVYREMKLRRHYEKPSEKRAREKAAAVRRARKLERKRMERDG